MKTRFILTIIILLIVTVPAEAQILKKLKKKVEKTTEKVLLKKTEEATEKTVEGSIDGISGTSEKTENDQGDSPEKFTEGKNEAKLKNTEAKQSFYTADVVVRTSDSKGVGSVYYFDSDAIAARGTSPKSDDPIFIDSEGFQYGYNKSNNRWEKTGLMRSDAMSFMMPMMSMGMLKLPAEPTLETSKRFKEQGLNMNTFQIVEWAFIYKPEHFRSEDYEETTVPCPDGGGTCPKFLYTDPEYKGSWVLFDDQGRLSEIYANVNTQQAQGDGSYKFSYEPVTVSLPDAKEVKMPFQDLFMTGADATPPGGNSGTSGNNNRSEPVDSDGMSHKSMDKMTENLKNSDLGTEDLPATYNFDWEYRLKMEMVNQKQDPLDLVFLLKKNTNYQGIKVENPKSGGLDEATMIFDLDINALLMFVESGGNKFLQIHPMQKPDNNGDLSDVGDFEIRELPDKTIMGYNSKGTEMENDKYIVQVYHTTQAPIEMTNLFNFSGAKNMNMPNIDPRLVKQFSEGLITEMHYTDKKKSKNNLILTAQSLNQVKTSINKNEYQNLSFMGQLKQGKN